MFLWSASDSVSWRTLRKVWTILNLLSLVQEPRGPLLGDLESQWKFWKVHFLISFCILIKDDSPGWQTVRANWPPNDVRARLLEDRSFVLVIWKSDFEKKLSVIIQRPSIYLLQVPQTWSYNKSVTQWSKLENSINLGLLPNLQTSFTFYIVFFSSSGWNNDYCLISRILLNWMLLGPFCSWSWHFLRLLPVLL